VLVIAATGHNLPTTYDRLPTTFLVIGEPWSVMVIAATDHSFRPPPPTTHHLFW